MIKGMVLQKIAAITAREIVKAQVHGTVSGWHMVPVSAENRDNWVSAIVTIPAEIIEAEDINIIRLLDTAGDVFYEDARFFEKREGMSVTVRIDMMLTGRKVEEHV